MPDELVANYELFSTKCSKCHTLARPLGAGITDDAQWEMYVTRMRLQPGSGISPEDQAQIMKFLRWHASELRRSKGIQIPSASASAVSAPPPAAPAQGAP